MKPKGLLRLGVIAGFLAMTALANAGEQGCTPSDAGQDRTPWRIVATDSGFDAPPCIPAGLRHLAFENRGSDIHEVMLIKLPEDMTAKQYLAAVRSGVEFPKGALDYSGPGLTSPRHRVEMWLRLDPGNYLLFCWYRLHSAGLPAHELKVIDDGSADSTPPKADVTVRQVDFRFEIVGTFQRGPQVIRFDTVGPSMHEADIFRLNDGMDVADVSQWKKSKDRPPPVTAFSGALDNHDIRRIVWLKTDLARGRYVLWCDMPMSTDPAASATDVTHSDAGMVHRFNVD